MDKQLYAYHRIPFELVRRGNLVADSQYSDKDLLPAYRWLQKEVGFFPLFLAVGQGSDAVYATGYQAQWSVFLGESISEQGHQKFYRKAGEFPNFVLFAVPLERVSKRVFTDYSWWHTVLTELVCNREVGKKQHRSLFKHDWHESKWLRHARRDGQFAQVVAPSLDLDAASFIWVRNQQTQRALLKQGFKNVLVKRLPVLY